jgi:hypothetical protein
VTNPEAYGTEFVPKAQSTIKAAGAKFLLIGGAGGASAKPIEAFQPVTHKTLHTISCIKCRSHMRSC